MSSISNHGKVHVLTECKACNLTRFAAGKRPEWMTTIPESAGIPKVPATYTFIAESSHEIKSHRDELKRRVFGKNNPKHTPYYTPMKSRIIEFTHGSEHNDQEDN
jgi:hypothetical protein